MQENNGFTAVMGDKLFYLQESLHLVEKFWRDPKYSVVHLILWCPEKRKKKIVIIIGEKVTMSLLVFHDA